MSPEAIQAALLEFGSRVCSCQPEEAMRAAIDKALEVEGIALYGDNGMPYDPQQFDRALRGLVA